MKQKTNPALEEAIVALKKQAIDKKIPLWKRMASELEKSTRSRRVVNINRINRSTKDGEIIIVPGKVLAGGELTHKVKVVAWAFSSQAKEKIKQAKGDSILMIDFFKKELKNKKIRIIG